METLLSFIMGVVAGIFYYSLLKKEDKTKVKEDVLKSIMEERPIDIYTYKKDFS